MTARGPSCTAASLARRIPRKEELPAAHICVVWLVTPRQPSLLARTHCPPLRPVRRLMPALLPCLQASLLLILVWLPVPLPIHILPAAASELGLHHGQPRQGHVHEHHRVHRQHLAPVCASSSSRGKGVSRPAAVVSKPWPRGTKGRQGAAACTKATWAWKLLYGPRGRRRALARLTLGARRCR